MQQRVTARVRLIPPSSTFLPLTVVAIALVIGIVLQVRSVPNVGSSLPIPPAPSKQPAGNAAAPSEDSGILSGVQVAIIGSVKPQSSPEEIASAALANLQRFTRAPANTERASQVFKLVSLTAVLASNIGAVESSAGFPDPGSVDDTTVWIARASGPFIGLRVPPGKDPIKGDTGYVVIDDATGKILQMGMP
jgi:hypothetical protein